MALYFEGTLTYARDVLTDPFRTAKLYDNGAEVKYKVFWHLIVNNSPILSYDW